MLSAAGKGPQADSARGRRLPPGGAAKAADVITYVEHGVCDMGVVGKDTIMENGSRFFEILDLGFGRCGFALAAPKGSDFYGGYRVKTIATKYPNVARRFFESKQMDVRVIKIEGSVELAPLLVWRTALWTLWKPAPPCGKTAWRWWNPLCRFPPG